MLPTLEKVIILKTVSIFAETPGEILADLAALVEEVSCEVGEQVFAQGDIGDSLYVVVDGKVRVHDGDQTLNYLGPRDVFGEMAVLDPEPRSATVTAEEDTLLLRLDQEPLFELIDDHSEVARGIFRVLARRIRERVYDVSELQRQLDALQRNQASQLV